MLAKSVVVVAGTDRSAVAAIAAGLAPAEPIDAAPPRTPSDTSAAGEGARRFEVVPCTSAHGALNACCAIEPDCLVAEFALGEHDAHWLVATLRAQANYVALLPIVMIAESAEEEDVISALQAGVDVVVPKPFNVVELVAQVRALVAMAHRFGARPDRGSRPSLPGLTSDGRARSMVGDLDRMPVATVLGALELERCTGELRLRVSKPEPRVLVLRLARGLLLGGQFGTCPLPPLQALTEALHFTGKHFEFVPEDDRPAPPGSEAIAPLLVQAVQLPPPSSLRTQSGSIPRIVPPVAPQVVAPPLSAPGALLVESMVSLPRPDPRAEPTEQVLAAPPSDRG